MAPHHFNKHRSYIFRDYLEGALAFYYQYSIFRCPPHKKGFGEQEKQSIFCHGCSMRRVEIGQGVLLLVGLTPFCGRECICAYKYKRGRLCVCSCVQTHISTRCRVFCREKCSFDTARLCFVREQTIGDMITAFPSRLLTMVSDECG